MSKVQEKQILKDLGAGLILRRSSPEDADALAAFDASYLSDDGPEHPDERIGAWVRDLLTRPHPTFHPDDFTIVEDLATGNIVSSLNLISQTWEYEGIPFGVGRPELVVTHPDYRQRGLVRAQFNEIHKWSAERGELAQAITGIPYFYRKFGYEMAMDLGGRRMGFEPHVPALKEGESEPYHIRPAARADISFIAELDSNAQKRYTVSCQRTLEMWEYELDGRSQDHINRCEMRVIEDEQGEPVGYFLINPSLIGSWVATPIYELLPGVSWLAVTPSVIRYLWQTGKEYAERDNKTCSAFVLWLGAEHPAYRAFASGLPAAREPYAWYIRVPDVPGFLRHIAPALEKRLAESIAAGHTGKIRINRYDSMLVLTLERGKLNGVDEEPRNPTDYGDLCLPELTILQLIFGRSSFSELHAAFPDATCYNDEAQILIDILFPEKHSSLFGIT
jgi:hypothetical protein